MALAKLPGKTCKNCGRKFTPTRTWQEFHSDACRDAFKREEERKDYVCAYCGLVGEYIDYIPPRDVRPAIRQMGIAEKYPVQDVRYCTDCRDILKSDKRSWLFDHRLEIVKLHLTTELVKLEAEFYGRYSFEDLKAVLTLRLNYESKK